MNFVYQKSLVEKIKDAKRNALPGRPLIMVEVSREEYADIVQELFPGAIHVAGLHIEGVQIKVSHYSPISVSDEGALSFA